MLEMLKFQLSAPSPNTRMYFSGWQYQSSPPTIQRLVEKALMGATKLERKDLHLVGASRTDKGVHAWGQVRLSLFTVQQGSAPTFHRLTFTSAFRLHTLSHHSTTKALRAFMQLSMVIFLRISELGRLALLCLNSMLVFQPKGRCIITEYIMTHSWTHFSVTMLTTVLIS